MPTGLAGEEPHFGFAEGHLRHARTSGKVEVKAVSRFAPFVGRTDRGAGSGGQRRRRLSLHLYESEGLIHSTRTAGISDSSAGS